MSVFNSGRGSVCAFALALVVGLPLAARAQTAQFYLRGAANADAASSFVGYRGPFISETNTPAFAFAPNVGVGYTFASKTGNWSMTLGAPVVVTGPSMIPTTIAATLPALKPGFYRLTTTVEGSNKFPHLQLSDFGDGHGCSGQGAMYVHESEYGPDRTPTKLAFDFSYTCFAFSGPDAEPYPQLPVWGSFRQNSSIPLQLDRAFAVADRGERAVLSGAPVQVDGIRSWSPKAELASYRWSQVSGPAVDLTDCNQGTCVFAAPIVARGGDTVVLALTVVDKDGRTDTDPLVLHVRHRGDRQSLMRLASHVNVWALNDRNRFYFSEYDGYYLQRTEGSLSSALGVQFSGINGNSLFSAELFPSSRQSLGVGEYRNAVYGISPNVASPAMIVTYSSRVGTNYPVSPESFFRIDALQRANDLTFTELGFNAVVNYPYFGNETYRAQAWINHQPDSTPTALVDAPATAAPGTTFTVDSRRSIDPTGLGLYAEIFQAKGASFNLVDASVAGKWTLQVPAGAVVGSHVQLVVEVEDPHGHTSADVKRIDVVASAASAPAAATPTSSTPAGQGGGGGGGGGGGAMDARWLLALALALAVAAIRWRRRHAD